MSQVTQSPQATKPALKLLDKFAVFAKTGNKNSKTYSDIAAGLFVQPIRLGERCSRWPEHEVDAILHARMAGATDDQVRALVTRLHEVRKEQYAAILAQVAA